MTLNRSTTGTKAWQKLWIPIVASIIVVILTLLFWQELLFQEKAYIQRNIELATASISHEITSQIQTRSLAIKRMAKRWEIEGGTPKLQWEADANNYFQDYGGFQALEWVDKSYHVRWIVPLAGNEAAQNFNMASEKHRRIAMEQAKQRRNVTISHTVTLSQRGKGFLMYVPLFVGEEGERGRPGERGKRGENSTLSPLPASQIQNRFDGFVVGVFRNQQLFDAILNKNIQQKYIIDIFDAGEKIYSNQELHRQSQPRWKHKTEVNLSGVSWNLQVSPTPAVLQQEKSLLPNVVLGGGLGMAVLVGWGVYLTQSSRRYAQQARVINSELAHEISERSVAEVKLNNLITALESAVEGVSQLDKQGRFVYVNQAYANMIGYQPEELIGMDGKQNIYPKDREKVMVTHQRMLEEGKAEIEARGVRQDGSVFEMQAVIVRSDDQQQNYQGYYCFVKDISHRREIERLKDEFVSVVSHELRTPLTSIRGSLGLIAGGVLNTQPEKAQRMLEIAVNNTDRLIRLINDILDIERIESGKVTMTKQIFDAATLMVQSEDEMRSMADKAGVTLSVSPVSATLWADPDRIVQTFTNLLSNAIKFSPSGGTIWFTAEVRDAGKQGAGEDKVDSKQLSPHLPLPPSILFTIRDQGRGIPAEKIETIFGRFQQVDASDSRKKGGTGLGLAICRSIITHHGGRIWAESTLGEGSSFYILLPLHQEEEPIATLPESDNIGRPLVLVCDDDRSIRTVMQTMLEQRGYRAICAASGQEALQQAAKQQPDVILLNLMMPGMHGWETLEVLKQQPHTKDIPVIILSGLMPDAREPHPQISDWIVKPPDEGALFQALEKAVAGEKSQSMKVLIVEDDLDLAQVLIAIFERYGIETYHAKTGREALRLSQRLVPDLLVLDLALPEVDGFAVVDWLRHHRRLCLVPLVVYCARDLSNFDRERLKLGQTLFLTKSRVTPDEFEQRVMALLHRMIPASKGDMSDSQTHSHN